MKLPHFCEYCKGLISDAEDFLLGREEHDQEGLLEDLAHEVSIFKDHPDFDPNCWQQAQVYEKMCSLMEKLQ